MSAETLFHEARGLTPSERAAYLEANCADPEMRRRIEDRLKSLESAAGDVDQTVLTDANVPQPAGTAEQAGVLIGPYKLLQKLGRSWPTPTPLSLSSNNTWLRATTASAASC
jgi:hypothetical protein